MNIVLFLNENTGVIQSLSTIVLVIITGYYAYQSKKQVELIKNSQKIKTKFTARIINNWVPEGEEENISVRVKFANIGLRDIEVTEMGYFSDYEMSLTTSLIKEKINLPRKLRSGEAINIDFTKLELERELNFVDPEGEDAGNFAGFYCEEATGEKFKCYFNLIQNRINK